MTNKKIYDTNAYLNWTSDGKAQTPISLNLTATVQVLSNNSFYFRYSDYGHLLLIARNIVD